MTILVASVLLAMTFLGAVASAMLKVASQDLRPAMLLRDWHFYAGASGYCLAALLNVWALRHADLSVVLPMTALTYVWTLLIANWFLGEKVERTTMIGVAFIILGVFLIGAGA